MTILDRAKKRISCAKAEGGQSLAELAVVLPLVLILIAGVFDLGLVIHSYTVVVNASREGALAGSAKQTDEQELRSLILDEMARGGATNGATTITITYANQGTPPQRTIIVDVTQQVPLTLAVLKIPNIPVRSHTEMITFWN